MGSGQIYKGTQSFALYWVGAAAAATSASEQSSVRISVCQSVLLLLLLQPPLHILKTETFYFVANLFRFVLFFLSVSTSPSVFCGFSNYFWFTAMRKCFVAKCEVLFFFFAAVVVFNLFSFFIVLLHFRMSACMQIHEFTKKTKETSSSSSLPQLDRLLLLFLFVCKTVCLFIFIFTVVVVAVVPLDTRARLWMLQPVLRSPVFRLLFLFWKHNQFVAPAKTNWSIAIFENNRLCFCQQFI